NLDALDEEDRAILTRALAKSPDERFASCTELIRVLSQAGTGTRPTLSGMRVARVRSAVAGRPQSARDTRSLLSTSATQPLGPVEGRALPDYQFQSCLARDPRGETWQARTAEGKAKIVHLFYGVGGEGGKCDPEAI